VADRRRSLLGDPFFRRGAYPYSGRVVNHMTVAYCAGLEDSGSSAVGENTPPDIIIILTLARMLRHCSFFFPPTDTSIRRQVP
jgi:hypothetical protein